jgi:subfamily B ATP-binding cassette protein MsbA
MREIRIRGFSALTVEALGGVGVAIIVYYGGHLVISGNLSAGAFFSFITALLMIYTPIKRLSSVNNNFQQARTILDRVREIAFVEPEKSGGIEKDIKGNIEFKGVSFRYPENEDLALNEIDIKIREGELIAVVGHSGAGKSTMMDLVAGFWYPTKGDIIIDGINIRELSLKSLRQHIGLVTQDVILFNETIKTNLHLGRPNASDEEIVEAAKAAYAHEFIEDLPDGYETNIGERGVRLSGGQKQRITIARAILKNPEILIFDEATSSLDSDSESKIQKAIENIIPGRTTIIIAHRLSTIRKADRILVMDRGKIIQDGQHKELLDKDGIYRELYKMQFELK